MKTFLVPVDFSTVTDHVIESAAELTRAFKGSMILFHVVQPPMATTTEYALPVDVVREVTATSEKAAKSKLAGYAAELKKIGIECRSEIKIGPPGPLVLETAQADHADAIIVGSHGHGKLYDFLVGSTASSIIKKAKCAVVIVPPVDRGHK